MASYLPAKVLRMVLLGSVSGMVSMAATSAIAQEQTAATNGDIYIPDIIVTAQKRAESLQNTPIAVSALDATALDQSGVKDVQGLTALVPNVTVRPFNNTLVVATRGISNENTTNLGDASLAFHVNGVYVGRPRAQAALFYDVERVELLRGPQGTLYGRNSTAGALNLISKKPQLDGFHAGADLSYGNYDATVARGYVNVAASDVFGIRGTLFYSKRDGFAINNRPVPVIPGPPAVVGAVNAANASITPTIKNGDDDDQIAGRLSLLYKPSDDFSISIVGGYHKTDSVGQVRSNLNTPGYGLVAPAIVGAGPGAVALPAGALFLPQAESSQDARVYSYNTQPEYFVRDWDITGEINYTFNDSIGLTSITGYREDKNSTVVDPGGTANLSVVRAVGNTQQFSQELRLVSTNKASAIDWLIGAYYFDESQSDLANINNLGGGPVNLNTGNSSISSKSYAVFGQAGYKLTDAVRLSIGGRFTNDKKSRVTDSVSGTAVSPATPFGAAFVPPAGPGQPPQIASSSISNKESWSRFNWKAGLDYKINDNSLLYGSVSTGYRAGGFNNSVAVVYDPEKITAYELGLKNELLGRRLRINFAGFYYDYKDLQISSPGVDANGQPGVFTQNAASAEVYGFEVEAVARPANWLSVDFSFGYLSAKFKDFSSTDGICRLNGFQISAVSALPGCITRPQLGPGGTPVLNDPDGPGPAPAQPVLVGVPVNYSGNRLSNAPDITLNVGANVTFFDNDSGSLVARGSIRLVGESFLSEYNRRPDRVKSYSETDLRLTYRSANQRFSIEGYVQNLENNDIPSSVSVTASGFGASYNPPRTYGVRVGYEF
jgi:iron complex outermembrane recepter protein